MKIKKNSQETIVDEGLHGQNDKSIYLEQNAGLIYWYKPTAKGSAAVFNFYLAEQAQLYFLPIITDAQSLHITVYLQGQDAHAYMYGSYSLQQKQQCSIKTVQYHQASFTTSNVMFNGVLSEYAQVDFHGSIVIEKEAEHSNAALSNKNLLFDQAQAISVPNLEVKTNEVQCKHGSAIGRLDDEQLFYMQSRGLPYKQAKEMLVAGFLQEVWRFLPGKFLKT